MSEDETYLLKYYVVEIPAFTHHLFTALFFNRSSCQLPDLKFITFLFFDFIGFLCPVHTPDGTPCGLLNHMTIACQVR